MIRRSPAPSRMFPMRFRGGFACAAVFLVSARALSDPTRGYHGALELQNGWAWTESDPRVDHNGPTWGIQLWLRDALALGVRGMVYTANADNELNFGLRRATRVIEPIEEYQWQSELTVTYVLIHGHQS